jgi:hypothetical protein
MNISSSNIDGLIGLKHVGIFYPIDTVPNYSMLYLMAFITSLSVPT